MNETTSAPTLVPAGSLEAKRRDLKVNRRRATGCLVAVTVVFLAVTVFGHGQGWVGYVQATAEASMVGGLADWFAVTALFRHPLGIPIPHTAVVPERKEQFAATLGEFVQESFLTPEVIAERVAAAGLAARLAGWLLVPANADRVAELLADAAVAAADVVEDEAVHQLVDDVVGRLIEAAPFAPLAGRALSLAMDGGRHQALFDAALRGFDRYLLEHQADLRRLMADRSPWWLPDAVEERVVRRLAERAHRLIGEIAADPGHSLRRQLDERLRRLAEDLQSSPELRRRGQELARESLDQPQLRTWVASIWTDLKANVRGQAAAPGSPVRRRLAATVTAAGTRLRDDPALAARLDHGAVAAARYGAEQMGDEMAALITTTINRWDAEETSDRLELLLGPDLQLIRINGTIVGGMAGLALHAVSHWHFMPSARSWAETGRLGRQEERRGQDEEGRGTTRDDRRRRPPAVARSGPVRARCRRHLRHVRPGSHHRRLPWPDMGEHDGSGSPWPAGPGRRWRHHRHRPCASGQRLPARRAPRPHHARPARRLGGCAGRPPPADRRSSLNLRSTHAGEVTAEEVGQEGRSLIEGEAGRQAGQGRRPDAAGLQASQRWPEATPELGRPSSPHGLAAVRSGRPSELGGDDRHQVVERAQLRLHRVRDRDPQLVLEAEEDLGEPEGVESQILIEACTPHQAGTVDAQVINQHAPDLIVDQHGGLAVTCAAWSLAGPVAPASTPSRWCSSRTRAVSAV